MGGQVTFLTCTLSVETTLARRGIQLARGQAINRVQPSESNIFWSDDRETVFYNGKGVAMAKLRTMCQVLTDELESLLHELLSWGGVPTGMGEEVPAFRY
jgi:hypothetical protein